MTQDILGFETQVSHERPSGRPAVGEVQAALFSVRGGRRGETRGQTLFAPQSPRVAESRILKQLPCGGVSVPCAFCFLQSGYFGH